MSRLRKRLHDGDNVVDTGVLVEYTKPPVEPHEPKRILDHHELRTCSHICKQVLVKWKDRLDKGSTWETLVLFARGIVLLFLWTKTLYQGGSDVKTMVLESLIVTTCLADIALATLSRGQGEKRSQVSRSRAIASQRSTT